MITLAAVLFGLVLSGSVAFAQALQVNAGKSTDKVPWRGSSITYINTAALRDLSQTYEQSYDPYYGMTLMFIPRWWFTDHLYTRLLFTLSMELTQANSDNGLRRLTMSDTFFDWVWTDKRLTIPGVGVRFTPSMRFLLPTSSILYNRNLVLGLGPGFGLSKSFKLHKGKWFSRIGLSYGFRVYKEFHRYNTVSQNLEGCTYNAAVGADFAGCSQTGGRNRSWRFLNGVSASLSIHPKWTLSATAFFINDIMYGLKASDSINNPQLGEVVKSAPPFARPFAIWSMVSVTYAAASWAYIGLGFQSYHLSIKPDRSPRMWLFNRATSVYLSLTVPITQLTDAIFGKPKPKKNVSVREKRYDKTRPQT